MLAFVLAALPAWAIAWGVEQGHVGFVLYREPKLVAILVLGWSFVAAYLVSVRERFSRIALFEVLEQRELILLDVLLIWLATTGLWALVPGLYLYELRQYLLLTVLLVALLLATRDDPEIARQIRRGLLFGLAGVTLVGLLQIRVGFEWLAPIVPEAGARNPSFMGYKNAAGLAVVGQIFLVAEQALRQRKGRRLAWSIVLGLELLYLVSLRSRTSWVAFAAGSFLLVVLGAKARREDGRILKLAFAALLLFGIALLASPASRERAASIREMALDTGAWASRYRVVYARNTLHMAASKKLGVGLGQWQTYYPVYRKYARDLAFTNEVQVRRAHGDHVQMLGEGGWPGLVLWWSFLAVLFVGCLRSTLGNGVHSAFDVAQLGALIVLMFGDYYLEMPYHKFQFFLVIFLVLAKRGPSHSVALSSPSQRLPRAVLLAFLLVASAEVALAAALGIKVHRAARLEQTYLRALPVDLRTGMPRGLEPPTREGPSRVLALAEGFAALPGETKGFHRTWLTIAHAAHLLGDETRARRAATEALSRHPFSPNGLLLMAAMAEDPEQRRAWERAYRYVMEEAQSGFEIEYPLPGLVGADVDP